jgi:hypothetical protein
MAGQQLHANRDWKLFFDMMEEFFLAGEELQMMSSRNINIQQLYQQCWPIQYYPYVSWLTYFDSSKWTK